VQKSGFHRIEFLITEENMGKENNPINDLIRGKIEQQTDATRKFAKRLFGEKESEEYMRGYVEGSKRATELALKGMEKALGVEGKEDE
jgi:hypothetical protein